MAATHALLCALALALTTQHATCSNPLPPHGPYRTSHFLDLSSNAKIYPYPEKRYKLNAPHCAGEVSGDLVGCPCLFGGNGCRALILNVTVFDYHPYVELTIDDDKMTAIVKRAKPCQGTMYGLVRKWCAVPDNRRSFESDNIVRINPLSDLTSEDEDTSFEHRAGVLSNDESKEGTRIPPVHPIRY